MKQPLLYNIFVIVMSSCMAIGLIRQEMRIDVQEKRFQTRIDVQEKRIQMLEDALLLEKKNQSAERPSRGLQENCECPFTKNEENDWVATDAESLFIFEKGIIIGKKNTGEWTPACNYGNSILSVDAYGSNCPSGDGSVTFGSVNFASGIYSAVLGGSSNRASGTASSITGGEYNVVSSLTGSISGGSNNVASGVASSISGGQVNIVSAYAESIPGECPFTKNEDNDWMTTDTESLFIFKKGIIIGKKNLGGFYRPACNYGNSILSVDADGSNCPSGDGSVTFGSGNTASGTSSAVVGGRSNEASEGTASISGGESNTVSAYAGSISRGLWNKVNGQYGSILGGNGHVLEAYSGTVSSKSNFKNATNATAIETIPAHHPEDRIVALEEHSPFNCTAEEGWCISENKRFLFSEGVVVGVKNPHCKYGTGTLSVDFMGTNCPAHRGSVTFGKKNQMSRAGSFTVG